MGMSVSINKIADCTYQHGGKDGVDGFNICAHLDLSHGTFHVVEIMSVADTVLLPPVELPFRDMADASFLLNRIQIPQT